MGLLGKFADAAKSQIESALKTSQVGREVLDTLQDISEKNTTNKNANDAKHQGVAATTTLEKENTKEWCDNLKYDYAPEKLNKTRFNEIKTAAFAGDPVAQYKYGYALAEAAYAEFGFEEDKKLNAHLYDRYRAGYDNMAKLTDLSNAKEESIKWLTISAKQGFGLAMYKLYSSLSSRPWYQELDAYYWLKRCQETIPWYTKFEESELKEVEKLLKDWKEAGSVEELFKSCNDENSQENHNQKSSASALSEFRYEVLYKEMEDKYNKLANKYNELLREAKQFETDYNELVDKYNDLLHSSSSSSRASSSSRSSGDDIVEVEITYKYKIQGIAVQMDKKKVVTMTQREYKSLLNGSMKSRIAYVNNHFIISTAHETVTDVSISLV